MKQIGKLALLSLLFLIAFSSCTKETEKIEEECLTSACLIVGEWSQVSSSGMMGFVNYDTGDITWTFNQNGTVDKVTNVAADGSLLATPIIETVNYTINGNEMEVGNGTWGFSMTRSEFSLAGNLALDGSVRNFERN